MLPVSLTFAAALAVLALWLGIRTAQLRRKTNVTNGDGGNQQLLARMRAQANFVEYSPFALVLVVLIERAGASRSWLWAVTAAYLVARILHPFGLERPAPNPLRAIGTLVTFLALAGVAIWAVVLANGAGATGETIRML